MFWKDFNNNVSEVKEKRTREVLDLLNESLGTLIFDKDKDGKVVRKCQLCDTGSLSLKIALEVVPLLVVQITLNVNLQDPYLKQKQQHNLN